MTQVLIDRATLERLTHGVEMGFDFDDGDVFGVMSNDMTDALSAGHAALAEGRCKESNERNTMNFLELRAAIISLLNKADNLCAEEVYGVIASVEAEVRLSMFAAVKQTQQEDRL